MKKIFYLLFLVLATGLFLPASALALTETVSSFQIGNNIYNYKGQQYEMDVAPFVKDGRTYIPVRYLANSIGISNENIKWDDASSKVTLKQGNLMVELIVDKPEIYISGNSQSIDAAPVVKEGRVFLPARYIAEAFRYSVDWNEDEALVSIYKEHLLWESKKYLDTEEHFSLYYPANWIISKQSEPMLSTLVIKSPPEGDDDDDFLEHIIVIHIKDPNIKSKTLDEMADFSLKAYLTLVSSEVYKNENRIIDGLPAKYFEAKCNDGKTDYYSDLTVVKIQDECFVVIFSVKNTDLYFEVRYTADHSLEILDEARKVLPEGADGYEGDWGARDSEGLIHPDGKGKLTYTNGGWYQGDIKNGQKHGEGNLIYYNPENGYWQMKSGIWENDQLIKETAY